LNPVTKTPRTALTLSSLLILGACGDPQPPRAAAVDVAQAAAREEDRVSVEELAHWIVESRGDFALVDVRTPDDFEAGAIGDAVNIPIAQLVTDEALADLPTDRQVIVYSNGSENAAKATVLLRLAGINAKLLVGGYNAWNARILNPDISAMELDGESREITEQRALACYFVGERSGAASRDSGEAEPFVPPVFEVPPEEADVPPPPPEEGC
jgi:rhodanese-related sulfurtransferase